jgi:hypothetical protein
LGFELIALNAKGVDLVEHPLQKDLGRGRRNGGTLKLKNIAPLLSGLDTHALDFRSDVLQPHRAPPSLSCLPAEADPVAAIEQNRNI